MELFILIFALLPIAFAIFVIARMITDSNDIIDLKRKLRYLNERVVELESQAKKPVSVDHSKNNEHIVEQLNLAKTSTSEVAKSPEITGKLEIQVPEKESVFSSFWLWLKTNFLMKIGALFIILAVSWFVGYAFVNNWIDPTGRVILGLIFGTCFIILGGVVISRNNPVVGQVLVLVGTTSALVSIWSAGNLFGLLSYFGTLLSLFVMIAFVAVLAIFLKARPLAVASAILAALIPFQGFAVVTEGLDFLLAYGFLLNVIALLIMAFRGWRAVYSISLVTALVYSSSLLTLNDGLKYIYFLAFFILLYSSQALGIFLSKKVISTDYFNAVLVNLVAIIWTVSYINRSLISPIMFGLAAVSLLIGVGFELKTKLINFFEIQFYSALIFLGVATAYALNFDVFPVLLLIFTELLLAQVFLGYVLSKPKQSRVVGILQLLAFFLGLQSSFIFYNYSQDYQITVTALSGLIFLINSFVSNDLNNKLKNKNKNFVANATSYISLFYLSTFIWILFERLLSSGFLAHAISLVIFTVIGIGLLYFSKQKDSKNWNYVGIVTITGVILRLVFVEIGLMPIEIRILTFIIIGLLLLLTAFITRKKK